MATRQDGPHPMTVQMFMEIQSKNNEMIKNLLPKMHNLFNSTEELQERVVKLETKLGRIERDNQNLHYELRSTHIDLDGRLKTILTEYDSMNHETNLIKLQTQEITRQINEGGNVQIMSHFGPRFMMGQTFSQTEEGNSDDLKSSESSASNQESGASNKRRIYTQHMLSDVQISKTLQAIPTHMKKSTRPRLKRKNSIKLEEQQSKQAQVEKDVEDEGQEEPVINKVQFLIEGSQKGDSIDQRPSTNSEHLANKATPRKGSLKKIASKKLIKAGTTANICFIDQEDPIKAKHVKLKKKQRKPTEMDQMREEMNNYYAHHQRMNKNYETLMTEYLEQQEVCFRQSRMDFQAQFQPLKKDIEDLKQRLETIDCATKESPPDENNEDLRSKIEAFQQILETKVDKQEWSNLIFEVNQRFKFIHEERRKLADRLQTKRAIEFLEQKLNSIIQRHGLSQGKGLNIPTQKNIHKLSIDENGCLVSHSKAKSSKATSRRGSRSPCSRLVHGKVSPTHRFNEQEEQELFESQVTQRNYHNMEINMSQVMKRSQEILSTEKQSKRGALKKEAKMIFQYD